MAPTDPRFLNTTYDEMLQEAYAADFALKRAKGGNIETFEDDPDLSLDNILKHLDEGTWEEVESSFGRTDENSEPEDSQ